MENYIIPVVVVCNLISFSLFYLDKRRSVRKQWRIPEKTLLLSAFLMGSLGALLGMRFCQHKTKKRLFTILVPLFLIVHILLFIFIFYWQKHGLF